MDIAAGAKVDEIGNRLILQGDLVHMLQFIFIMLSIGVEEDIVAQHHDPVRADDILEIDARQLVDLRLGRAELEGHRRRRRDRRPGGSLDFRRVVGRAASAAAARLAASATARNKSRRDKTRQEPRRDPFRQSAFLHKKSSPLHIVFLCKLEYYSNLSTINSAEPSSRELYSSRWI